MATPNRPRSLSTGVLQRSSSMTSLPFMRRMAAGNASSTYFQAVLANERKTLEFQKNLPRLTERDLEELGHGDSMCPICLNTFLAILAEEEMATVMDSPAHNSEDLGVTRFVDTCGHIFCRKDIRNWMREGRTTCPTCRTPFIPPSPSDPPDDWAQILPSDILPLEDLTWLMAAGPGGFGMDGNDMSVQAELEEGPVDAAAQTEDEERRARVYEASSEYAGMYS